MDETTVPQDQPEFTYDASVLEIPRAERTVAQKIEVAVGERVEYLKLWTSDNALSQALDPAIRARAIALEREEITALRALDPLRTDEEEIAEIRKKFIEKSNALQHNQDLWPIKVTESGFRQKVAELV